MKCCVIANSQARHGRTRASLDQLHRELERQRIRADFLPCTQLEAAGELSRQANAAGYDVIVAVGGDGTINRVLNGFFDANGRRVSHARMGVVHIGTSPDFCRSYGIPTAVAPAVQTLAEGITRPIPVGRIVCQSAEPRSNGPRSACFGCCANIGLGAALARSANSGIRNYAGDFAGTFISLIRVLLSCRPCTLELTLDGREQTVSGVYNLSVGKTFYIASGLKVRHELGALDSRFYVLSLRHLSWLNVVHVLRAIYSGRPIRSSRCLSLEYARSVAVSAPGQALEVEYDGDPAGLCPCRIEAAPDPLDLIVGGSHAE